MKLHLDISIGPVQGFVAQSRRTRDLWGSSYLLSFLAAHALCGAEVAGGQVSRPNVDDDPLFRWVKGQRTGDAPPIGSVPNHFVLAVDGDAAAVAEAAIRALQAAWERVCTAVWERFVADACAAGHETAEIWQRQVGSFWEIQWTAGPADPAGAGGLLARRKHWRSHRQRDEPGDKCTVMHDLQELSGYVRAESRQSREQQDDFWGQVRGRVGQLDLRVDERLCAIALVKRLFPRVAADALGRGVDRVHWPSTVYVGAVPWIRQAMATAPESAAAFAAAVRQDAPDGVLAERRPPFPGLDVAVAGDFPKLDANYLHRGFVQDERLCPLKDAAAPGVRDGLERLLKAVHDATAETGRRLGPPPVFYALLLADGDRLGAVAASLGGDLVGRALSAFTGAVPDIVRAHDGVTVYAGGDDVLAMLPVPRALACARALAVRYAAAFANAGATPGEGTVATLSAAAVFAHVRLPLGVVIGEAHRLLDAVAKDANGRNSVAAAVLKRGGLNCQWVTAWKRRHQDGGSSDAVELIDALAGRLGSDAAAPGLSSALLYRIRELLGVLCGWPQWFPGSWGPLMPGLDVRSFLRAEIVRTLADSPGADGQEGADKLADLLWKLLGPARTQAGVGGTETEEAGVDALLLARFLASGGHEEDAG